MQSNNPTTKERLGSARLKLALSELLHAELVRLDITAYELAKRSGLPQQSARDYLAGATEPSLSRVLALERGLGRPAGWLTATLSLPR